MTTSYASRKELLLKILRDSGVSMGSCEFKFLLELSYRLKVPSREDCLRNFLSAYLRLVHGILASKADKIASSSKGRRHWEKKLRKVIRR